MSVKPMITPLITPRQMNFLRAVTALAWADGVLEQDEVNLITEHLLNYFNRTQSLPVETLKAQIQGFVTQNIPLAETLPRLQDLQERELLLKLAYLVINVSRRTPDEPFVNQAETVAYGQLIAQLDLSPDSVVRVEAEARNSLSLEAVMGEISVCI